MAHKTFISYKYSDVVEDRGNNNLRDRIISKLGVNAQFYRGENGFTKDISSYSANYIKETLKDKLYDTSVTIVILSPNMKLSDWIEWELEYSLRNVTRGDRTSRPNGIVAVVQKQPTYGYGDGYSWLKNHDESWNTYILFSVIKNNRNNRKYYAPSNLPKDYIDIITEDAFLRDPNKYIDEAFYKCQNSSSYNLSKQGEY